MYHQRNQENSNQQIGHGHVDDYNVDGLSHCFRLVDNSDSDDGVPSQRDKNN